jgi:hypothetical protein
MLFEGPKAIKDILLMPPSGEFSPACTGIAGSI